MFSQVAEGIALEEGVDLQLDSISPVGVPIFLVKLMGFLHASGNPHSKLVCDGIVALRAFITIHHPE